MANIATYVFFDIETTGLPFQERNLTKIIEASFVSCLRKDIEACNYGELPPVSKLTFVLNPCKKINPQVVKLTGLSNKFLQHAPLFKDKFKTLFNYLEGLVKPVCLVAHNGNTFDFKILLAECLDANAKLPDQLLCCDSLVGFRKFLKGSMVSYKSFEPAPQVVDHEDIFLTDDEDDWPDFNVNNEQWEVIDDICLSLSDCSDEELMVAECEVSSSSTNEKKNLIEKRRENVIKDVLKKKSSDVKCSFKLTDLYKRLFNKDENNAHRAEVDCLMLIYCVVAMKSDFITWSDKACKLLTEIKPLNRY